MKLNRNVSTAATVAFLAAVTLIADDRAPIPDLEDWLGQKGISNFDRAFLIEVDRPMPLPSPDSVEEGMLWLTASRAKLPWISDCQMLKKPVEVDPHDVLTEVSSWHLTLSGPPLHNMEVRFVVRLVQGNRFFDLWILPIGVLQVWRGQRDDLFPLCDDEYDDMEIVTLGVVFDPERFNEQAILALTNRVR